MPEITISETISTSSTTTIKPTLKYCPTCANKLIPTVLTGKDGSTINTLYCPKCYYMNNPEFRSKS